jgi:starch phosphorylase
VHAPTWVSPLLRHLYEKYIGADWATQLQNRTQWEQSLARISDEEIWVAHSLLKERLVAFLRYRSFQSRRAAGERADYVEAARTMFDASALTIGFARRVAGYKRWNLLLTDPSIVALT